MAYLTANALCYQYPKSNFSLKNISLALERGTCTTLLGSNGSGKTTLGKLLTGIIQPQSGEICIDGINASTLTLAQIGKQVGYLFQEPARQLFAPVVLEEITFTLRLLGMGAQEAEGEGMRWLEMFGLRHMAGNSALHLSRGEKQRLALCAILVNHPKFLILDEPTTGLDSGAKDTLSAVLKQLLVQGVGVCLISHDREFIQRHTQCALRLEEGELHEE